MSKNTMSSAFRTLQVSAYSDDEDEDDNQQIEEVGPNEAEVQGFLAQYPFQLFLGILEQDLLVSRIPRPWGCRCVFLESKIVKFWIPDLHHGSCLM